MKNRYFIKLSYKGTKYHGWQVQQNALTVQEVLEDTFSTILREKIRVIGCGRTDTGVHARNFIAHFDSFLDIKNEAEIVYKANRFLSQDIVIHRILCVDNELHSRFSAVQRTYHYYIVNSKNPFCQEFAYYYPHKLDVDKMNEACAMLFNYQDFTSFSKLHSGAKNNLCTIVKAHWQYENEQLVFRVSANRFLRNMVRAIVGTMLDVGRGKLSPKDVAKIIEAKNRSLAGQSVPAKGLFLTLVEYDTQIF